MIPMHCILADVPHADPIYTYDEGGCFLQQALKMLSFLLYGDEANALDQTFTAILRIALTIGAFSCICFAFARQSFIPIVRNFLFFGLICSGFLLVPQTQVYVIDVKNGGAKEVLIKIPFFLGKAISWTSCCVAHLHEKLIGKDLYPWLSQMASEKHPFSAKGIVSLPIENDVQTFCRHCVPQDLKFGLYARQDLLDAENLFAFLQDGKSSMHTAMPSSSEGKEMLCSEAIKRLQETLTEEVEEWKGEDVSKRLFSKDKSPASTAQWVGQKMLVSFLREPVGFLNDFTGQRSFSSFGISLCLALFGFLEAVVILWFPFSLLLSVISFGARMIFQWIKLFLWASIWPLFYPIIEWLLQSMWAHRTDSIPFYTLKSSNPLFELYHSMEAIALAALLFVPLFSWLVIKGVFHQAVHIVSSAEDPARSVQKEEKSDARFDLQAEAPHQENGLCKGAAADAAFVFVSSQEDFQRGVQEAKEEDRSMQLQKTVASTNFSVNETKDKIVKSIGSAVQEVISSQLSDACIQPEPKMEDFEFAAKSQPIHGSWM